MKKFFYSAMSLVVMAGLYSCSDSDPNFQIWHIQANHAVQLSASEFKPIIGFQVAYGTLSATATKISKDGQEVPGASYTESYYETNAAYLTVGDISGLYTLGAVSTESQQAVQNLTMTFDRELGEFTFDNVELSGGKLKLTITEPSENATHYGFYMRPIINGSVSSSWIFNGLLDAPVNSNGDLNFEVEVDTSALPNDYMIYPAAIRGQNNSNPSLSTLVRYDAQSGILLKKGASSLE